MLTLLLLRHAKASPAVFNDDFDRDLTDGGKADAGRLGAHLARMSYAPTLALVSAARRTTETFDIVTHGFGKNVDVRIRDDLYNATSDQIFAAVNGVDATVETLLVVGHNPGIMDVAVAAATDGDHGEIERMRGRFPPCALAVVTFSGEDWQDVRAGAGRLVAFIPPESLSQVD